MFQSLIGFKINWNHGAPHFVSTDGEVEVSIPNRV